jgi:predicted ATP-grasp superfamily ATP-dependent carboligase
MATIELLEEAIRVIIYRAGIDNINAFHLICVSAGTDGIFIMDTLWPEGRRIYQAIGRAVERFPNDTYTSCVALLPDMVEAIISSVPLRRSGRAGGLSALLPVPDS